MSTVIVPVFVYGTLRKGGFYHYYMQEARLLQADFLLHGFCLYDFQQAYPYMVEGLPEQQVKGEVYAVGEALLRQLHELEEVDKQVYRFVYLPDYKVSTYLKASPDTSGMSLIPGGDWIDYIKNTKTKH